jgi:hypothetical protein
MSKRYTVTLHHVITVYHNMFDYMHCLMRGLAKKKTQCKADSFFAVQYVRQKLLIHYAEVTSTTGILLISTHILDPSR